jgi:hypothetical protein
MKNVRLMSSLSFVVFVVFSLSVNLSGQQSPRVPQAVVSARPASVPENFVITPFGYFHPSCVRSLTANETLLSDGRVQHANGATDAQAAVCGFPHFTPTGVLAAGNVKLPFEANLAGGIFPAVNGWLEYISATTTASYGEVSASWPVPAAPSTNDDQTIFFFPGFQDYNNSLSIVQPVLQWGVSSGGGGSYWVIASWNCCMNGITWHSALKKVSAGDTILGTIAPTCPPKKAQSCTTWKIVTEDVTTGKKSTLTKSPAEGQVWNWAFGSVAEVYGVRQCSDYPADTSLTFSVQLYDNNGVLLSDPGWIASPAAGNVSPQCNYGLNFTDTEQTLEY